MHCSTALQQPNPRQSTYCSSLPSTSVISCSQHNNRMNICDNEDMKTVTESETIETEDFKLLNVQEVPDHHKEISIITGYRQRLEYQDCIKSIFKLHNETVNIWTHLLGFMFFFCLMIKDICWSQEHIRDSTDYSATVLQLLTYQGCMLSSSLFHTMSCHDSRPSWQRLDHASILIALYGTYVRVIINNFQCFPGHQTVHLAVVTILFGTVLFIKYWNSGHKSPKSQVSLPLFMALALYSVAPFAHWVSLSNLIVNSNVTNTMVLWMVFPYIVAGVGVLFYVTHFPEITCCSGTFDLYGSSHQIWHVLIFSGMASWYWLSCWVSTTRPETCVLTPVSQETNITMSAQLLNSSFLQYWL